MALPVRKVVRVAGHDYGTIGYYFVTVCVADRKKSLGRMADDRFLLSEIGALVETDLRRLPERFEYVDLDVFQVMPDHVHAILGLMMDSPKRVQFRQFAKPQSRSLSMVVNHFKGAVTREARRYVDPMFNWQGRFYEHLIRGDKELEILREYVVTNPQRWYWDRVTS